jgi:crotonobetainyl-CoA:carnitine CoA-transferase CaiB-like acyl-CoA transferase
VYDLAQALDNPFAHAVGMVRTVPHAQRRDFRTLANPIKLDGERPPSRPAPALGADSDAVLGEAGYSSDEIRALRAEGIV